MAALLTMGISTVVIGLLPTYAQADRGAALALCRLGRRGPGRRVGRAALATENAPARQARQYGMFPQLGAPIGFCSTGVFHRR